MSWLSFSDGAKAMTLMDKFRPPVALKKVEKLLETIAEENDGWVKVENAHGSTKNNKAG